MTNIVLVFGSNLAGRHGAGSAKFAHEKYGAQYGVGVGRTGNAYAIPTKNEALKTMPLEAINEHISVFLDYARNSPDEFIVVAIGCGLAGYKPRQIAWMFKDYPPNVSLPIEFRKYLGE